MPYILLECNKDDGDGTLSLNLKIAFALKSLW